jgi:hypothetical protein
MIGVDVIPGEVKGVTIETDRDGFIHLSSRETENALTLFLIVFYIFQI